MLWIALATLGAVANAGYYITAKRFVAATDRNVFAAGSFSVTGIILLILALARGIPPIGDELFMAIAATSALNVIATTLVLKALSATDISLAVPMISFTPVFLILTSFLLLGEVPAPLGVAGICVIVLGSYFLNLSSSHRSFFDPFKAVISDRGTASMLLVAFIYSVALNFDKMVVMNSDPVFGSSLVFLVLGLSFFAISILSAATGRTAGDSGSGYVPAQGPFRLIGQYYSGALAFVITGVLLVIEAVTINYAFTMQIVPYVISIKRMSIILTVLYGTVVACEGETIRRLAGAGLMVAGAVMIIVST